MWRTGHALKSKTMQMWMQFVLNQTFFFFFSPPTDKKIEKLDTDDLDEIEKIANWGERHTFLSSGFIP